MNDESHGNDNHEAVFNLVRAEMAQVGKQETLEIFGELLDRLWERLILLIGETATVAVFHSALLEASREHPLLQEIDIENSGIGLNRFKETLDALDRNALRKGLLAFTDSVMALVIDLTGQILSRKMEPLVQQFKQKLENT
ncbi:MAG: hypothetical protein NVS2B14_03210 [Chamaesiphon sp.]